MNKKSVDDKIPIYKLESKKKVLKYYENWTKKDNYNQDMIEWNYSGPKETVDTFKKYATNKDMLIFDAGCGTGLVGLKLKEFGYKNFHGADLSQKLLDTIPEKLYQKLIKLDLNQTIDAQNNFYDATMCVGTFTFGHVKPQALDEFVRITKKGGLICFTINEGVYIKYGFDKKINELKKQNKWKQLEFFKSNYIASKDVNAWLGLFEVME